MPSASPSGDSREPAKEPSGTALTPRQGRRVGGRWGGALGALAGAAFPVALGAASGGNIGEGLGHLADWGAESLGHDLPESAIDAGKTLGHVGGGLTGLGFAPFSAASGYELGRRGGADLGEEAGHWLSHLAPAERHHVQTMHDLPLEKAYVYHRTAARSGQLSPETLHAMHRVYHQRRERMARGDKYAESIGQYGLGPQGGQTYEEHGKRLGRGLGSLYGLGMAVGAPMLLGGLAGPAIGMPAEALGFDIDHDALARTSKSVGTAAGGALGLAYLAPRTLAPHATARAVSGLGGWAGRQLDAVPRRAQMLRKVRELPDDEYGHYVDALHRAGHVSGDDLKAVQEARRIRDTGREETTALQQHMAARGVGSKLSAFDPLAHPETSPAKHRLGVRTMGVLGGLAGAGAGSLAAGALGDSPAEALGMIGEGAGRGLGAIMEGDPSVLWAPAGDSGISEHLQDSLKRYFPDDRPSIVPGGLGAAAGAGVGAVLGAGAGAVRHGLDRLDPRERGIRHARAGKPAPTNAHPEFLRGYEEATDARRRVEAPVLARSGGAA